MGPTALLPVRRKSCYEFLSPLKIHRPVAGWTSGYFVALASDRSCVVQSIVRRHTD
jgi:hypothetical protein